MPERDRGRVTERLRDLAHDARPHGSQKIAGEDRLYRLRVGDWRVLYVIIAQEDVRRVLVSRVKRRNEATYR